MIYPLILLDFDGVIVDSAPECFETAYEAIFLIQKENNSRELLSIFEISKIYLKSVFIYYRGIVGPPEHFMTLLLLSKKLIDKKKEFKIAGSEVLLLFNNLNRQKKLKFINFKKVFFQIRNKNKKNLDIFIKMNNPTKFTQKIIKVFGKNWPFHILSAKDESTIKLWLDYFEIQVQSIIGNEILEKYHNNKYNVVKDTFFNKKDNFEKGLFIDDFEKNLDPRFLKLGIKTYFATWGYGSSNNNIISVNEESAIKKIKLILK